MIEAFLLKSGLFGLKNWIWIAAASVLVATAFVVIEIADNRDKRLIETAEDRGRDKAVSQGKSTTLKQNKDANDAEQEINRGGDAAVDGCVSDARGDASGCERFRN